MNEKIEISESTLVQSELPIEIPIVTPEIIPASQGDTKSIPPRNFARTEHGLLYNVNYIYQDDGFVNWKAMIDPKFLYLNADVKRRSKIETKYGKKFEEIKINEDKVDDSDLCIALGGIKQLLRLRGYSSVHYTIHESSDHYASVNCTIYFAPNFETSDKEVRFSDNACAHFDNTSGFGKAYLLEICTNRAFCRCVRNFLSINIVAADELSNGNSANAELQEDMATTLLKDTMAQHGVTWEKIQSKLVEEKVEGAENFKGVQDISRVMIFALIERIKKRAAEKATEKK